jgi:catechol 2,3-dioxygenase-like lactoylglutathione lyase family enzyme
VVLGSFHHIGCAVSELEASIDSYRALLGGPRCTRVFAVTRQSVKVAFIELAPGSYLELIQGTIEQSPVARYVRTGFYHLCFLVDDLDATVAGLDRARYRALPAFASEAFAGNRCQFVVTPETHLIELAEMAPAAFAAFFAAACVST